MPSLGEQLEQAREDVNHVRQRIDEQTALINRLRSEAHDTKVAAQVLVTFLDLLAKSTLHRDELERQAEERSREGN